MTTWYLATRDTPPPVALKLVAYTDKGGDLLGEVIEQIPLNGPNPVNQTRSNMIHQLLRAYGDRFQWYEEWHASAE